MSSTDPQRRSPWWAFAGFTLALTAAVAARAEINPWLFGALLLIAWGLLAYGVSSLSVMKPLRYAIIGTSLALAVFAWNHMAPQPRVSLDAVRLGKLPSTVQPGVVELVVRNSGTLPAQIDAFPVAYLAQRFRSQTELAAANMQYEIAQRLDQAEQQPSSGSIVIPAGKTAQVDVEVPASQRVWFIGRGEVSVLVAARLQYQDRLFSRETTICYFANPQSNQWSLCPFLNE